MTRGEIHANDAVGRGCECPTCGAASMDYLDLDDDACVVTCGNCGSVYALA